MKRKRSKSIRISGFVSIPDWGMEDLAELEVTTDFGRTYYILGSEALGDPYDWVDRYVDITGVMTRKDDVVFISPTRIREDADSGHNSVELASLPESDSDTEWVTTDEDFDLEKDFF